MLGIIRTTRMKTEKAGALVARGVGMTLIVIGGSATVGLVQVHTTEMAKIAMIGYLPCLIEAAVGLTMLVCSRPIGRLFAKGLSDDDDA